LTELFGDSFSQETSRNRIKRTLHEIVFRRVANIYTDTRIYCRDFYQYRIRGICIGCANLPRSLATKHENKQRNNRPEGDADVLHITVSFL
jgi:hypothetical protein